MRRLLLQILFASAVSMVAAQNTTILESVTEVTCDNPKHATIHYREVKTLHNEKALPQASFVCSCNKEERLVDFRGQVTDASGRVIRKIKQGDLQRTEYSQYLAIDDYKMYYEYTPPSYPVTITYEWTMDAKNTLIEFPWFCPQDDYDVDVRQAVYQLTIPSDMTIHHVQRNIVNQPTNTTDGKGRQVIRLELNNLPALQEEAFSRPLREKVPVAFFAPLTFIYYGTQGSTATWKDFGRWEYSLLQGRDQLPEGVRQDIHLLTDHLDTEREKVAALYHYLEKTTRYVAVLLGIGGMQPAPAAEVAKSGFGDCKGLSNYMRAMLKEIGIASNYTIISTRNRQLFSDFASAGQLNHVILQVPLKGDTLWLECTNPQLPLGYVHDDIAGHDAVVITENGGELVSLPTYADSVNTLRQHISVSLTAEGSADVRLSQTARYREYEKWLPLLTMDKQDFQRVLLRMMSAPQATVSRSDIHEDKETVSLSVHADITSKGYATVTGQRLFVPLCPLRKGFQIPNSNKGRAEELLFPNGYLDESLITLSIPDGYDIEAMPKDLSIEKPFGSFSFHFSRQEGNIQAEYRLLLKKGSYDKSLFADLTDFMKRVGNAYTQKIVFLSAPLHRNQ